MPATIITDRMTASDCTPNTYRNRGHILNATKTVAPYPIGTCGRKYPLSRMKKYPQDGHRAGVSKYPSKIFAFSQTGQRRWRIVERCIHSQKRVASGCIDNVQPK